MPVQLAPATGSPIALSANALWSDEYAWGPVQAQVFETVTGAIIIEESVRQAGRPITLTGLWLSRATVDALRTEAAKTGQSYTLTLVDASTHTVAFRHHDGLAVEAGMLFPRNAPDSSELCEVTLRLMEI